MVETKFTEELKKIFEYIQNPLLKEYDTDKITTEYFILSLLENDFSIGNRILTKIMLLDTIEETKLHFYQLLSTNARVISGKRSFDEVFQKSVSDAKQMSIQEKSRTINSGHMLSSVIANSPSIGKYFKLLGVTQRQLNMQVAIETNNIKEEEKHKTKEKTKAEVPIKHTKKMKKKEKTQSSNIIINKTENENSISNGLISNYYKGQLGECEKTFTNLNLKSKDNQIEEIYGNEDVYNDIFVTLSKRNKNNIIIVGKSGVGKTSTVRNLANLIVKGKVPKTFQNKILLEISFNSLFVGTGMRGTFEAKLKAIMTDACSKGNYIFFIDSLSSVVSSKFNETDVENFIESVMEEKKIMLICTCSEKGYAKEMTEHSEWERYFEKITLNEPSEEQCVKILKHHAKKLSFFHNVTYSDNVFDICSKYSKRYITERNLPDSAIDILDKAGAKISLSETDNEEVRTIKEKLNNIKNEKNELRFHANSKRDFNKLDKIEKEEIWLQSLLDITIKRYNLQKQPLNVTENDIKECISEKTSIPLQKMSVDDKERLDGLNDRIKKNVIGQDDAIDEVCKSIKRQRIGISNPNKPIVFFFGGSTGVGKTFLTKIIAKEIWGDENSLIRLDMSEYSESNSVTKLYGAPPSYVGYGDNTSLADKLKNKKYCILLLDEIEKACDKVYNVFLQFFDEGRITDNKGNTVDCKNIIVIMTSNIAAKEISMHRPMGFIVNNNENTNKDIIKKELKKTFNPEFLNRVDDFIYFNKLTKDNVRHIIRLNIKEIEKRVNNIGYGFDKNINDNDFIEHIDEQLNGKEEYGARPIKKVLQHVIEDKICNMIIENKVMEGYQFKKTDFLEK